MGSGTAGSRGQGEALKRLNFNGFIFCLCPNHLGGCYIWKTSLPQGTTVYTQMIELLHLCRVCCRVAQHTRLTSLKKFIKSRLG